MDRTALRNRLFRLIILLKLAMWMVVVAALAIGLGHVALGRDSGPPMGLIWLIPLLIAAQLAVYLVWRRMGPRE